MNSIKKWISPVLLAFSFSLVTLACSSSEPKITADVNENASLAGAFAAALPANPLQWKVISSEINQHDSTMSTLYGNDVAVAHARAHSEHNYPAGSVISLVTWTQREDSRWFGAKIPDQVKSVEFVTIAGDPVTPQFSYQGFEGSPLKKISQADGPIPNQRAAYLLSQRAAVLP